MPLSFAAIPLIKTFSNDEPSFNPYDIAVADFNQDGKLDINTDENMFLGDGLGSFQEVTLSDSIQSALGYASPRVTTDLNRDGKADIVALTLEEGFSWPSKVLVLLGDGSGSFSSTQTFSVEPNTRTLTVADFNRDNIPDVVTASSGNPKDRTAGKLSILLGDGNRGLKPAKSVASISKPLSLVAEDFNGDGKKDLAVQHERGRNTQLTVLLGNGKGGFKSTQSIALETAYTTDIVTSDFNKDGRADIAYTDARKVYVLFGTRQGTFELHNQFRIMTGADEWNLIKGDMNGDGHLDLAVSDSYSGDTGGTVLLGNGKGDFGRGVSNFSASVGDDHSEMGNAFDVVAADFNGDGKLDWASADGASYYEGQVTIFLNTTTNQDAIAISDYYSVDASSEQSGSIIVDLSKRTFKYKGSNSFNTRLTRDVDTVVGTTGNDRIQGNNRKNKFGDTDNFLNGYDGNDVITGLGGKDLLIGGAGDDKLTGGRDRDKFVFSNTPNYPEGLNRVFNRSRMGVDQLQDFQTGVDKIILDGGTFTVLNQKIQFASVDSESAAATNRAILTYVRSTGKLYYNANGSQSGFGSGGLFAELGNEANLSAKDFSVFL